MNDSDHRKTASHVLHTAHKVVTTERGNQHGGAEDSFQMIGDLWGTYLSNTKDNQGAQQRIRVTAYDVAQMMVLLKIARATHGDPLNDDHYIDAAGYTGLAAAIAGVKTPEQKAEAETTKALAKAFSPATERAEANEGRIPVQKPVLPRNPEQV